MRKRALKLDSMSDWPGYTHIFGLLYYLYNTMQLIFDIALLSLARKAQKCIYTPRWRRCSGIADCRALCAKDLLKVPTQ